MRIIGSIVTALMILGLAAFSVVSGQQLNGGSPSAMAFNPTAAPPLLRGVIRSIRSARSLKSVRIPPRWLTFPLIPRPCAWRKRPRTPSVSSGSAPNASAQPKPAPAASSIPLCDKPSGMGLARIVEVDTTGGPGFGFEHFKQYDFLRDKEIVLTFDDGPWPGNTPAVLKALTDECLKATFFEIGEHATWHPEITKQVIAAGMTVGTHTWSHKDLARNPYAKDIEQAKQEIEMGNSAVHLAAGGGKIAPFFRFPALQHPPQLMSYLAERNIGVFSTDIDFARLQAAQARRRDQIGDEPAREARQRHHPDARLQAPHRRGDAGTYPPAQGGRLQSGAHGAEGRAHDRAEVRRNARARGQAIVQQYAA